MKRLCPMTALTLLLGNAIAHAQSHVAPDPPREIMAPMSAEDMVDVMAMDDNARFGKIMVDKAEAYDGGGFGWDVDGWYGSDFDKLRIKSEGEHDGENAFIVEVLWDHVFARWWSVQSGLQREATWDGQHDTSLVIAVQGLAPQWFEIDARLYLSDAGISLHTEIDYEVLLSQRLVLEPSLRATVNNDNDVERDISSGGSQMELGLRLRYELRREFAPYIGVRWVRSFGATADRAERVGREKEDVQALAGLRFWF